VLQEGEVLAVGATRAAAVDLRLVAATHRDLEVLIREEKFRADLFARLAGFVVRLPSLRERIDDLGLLIASLLRRHAKGSDVKISAEALRLMLRYPWPLNIRELEHALRAALALAPERISAESLPAALRAAPLPPTAQKAAPAGRSLTPEQAARRDELCALLAKHRGNISEVARAMGKDRVQIRRWMRAFGISADKDD
jgi:transcriptional regulator of acetoin/glycerol metabolism